jgi:hypothetical protein
VLLPGGPPARCACLPPPPGHGAARLEDHAGGPPSARSVCEQCSADGLEDHWTGFFRCSECGAALCQPCGVTKSNVSGRLLLAPARGAAHWRRQALAGCRRAPPPARGPRQARRLRAPTPSALAPRRRHGPPLPHTPHTPQVPHRNAQGGVRNALLVQASYPQTELRLPATFNATYHMFMQLLRLGYRPWDILVRQATPSLPSPAPSPCRPALAARALLVVQPGGRGGGGGRGAGGRGRAGCRSWPGCCAGPSAGCGP